jgi:hypothetical protein
VYEVRDGKRVLQFDGELLSESSSRRPDNDRWVEFQLYRTKSGSYILGRIGQTRLFHALDCPVVERNKLKPSGVEFLTDEHIACEQCDPDDYADEVAIEKPRYFALISEKPEAILEALYKYDPSGARYLTHVAQRLVEDACEYDSHLERAYRVEYIY